MNTSLLDLQPARAAFKTHQEAFDKFARFLAERNQAINLTRIEVPEQIRTRHFLDSLAGLSILDEAAGIDASVFSMIDIGSGAGFPGLAIAIVRPEWRIVSVEATEKKVQFQRQICDMLRLTNVTVLHGRGEVLAQDNVFREQFNAATARALAGLNVLAELAMGFVRPGGRGVFWKGPQVQEEMAGSGGAFEKMGAKITGLSGYRLNEQGGTSEDEGMLYLAIAEKICMTPANYPRQNYAAIKKRPLS